MVQCMMTWPSLMLSTCLICTGIASFLFGMAAVEDLKKSLRVINGNTKSKKTRLNATKQLYHFISFHSQTKRSDFEKKLEFNMFSINDIVKLIHFDRISSRTVKYFMEIYQTVTIILILWTIEILTGGLLLFQIGIVESILFDFKCHFTTILLRILLIKCEFFYLIFSC